MKSSLRQMYGVGILAFILFLSTLIGVPVLPALLAVTASLGKAQPGKFFGILRSSQGLSFAIGPALGSLFSLISLRAPFLADGLFSLLAFLIAMAMFKDMGKSESEHDLRLFNGLRSAFSNKRVYVYLLMGISALFGWGILGSFVPTKSQLIELEAWQIGLILAGGALVFSFVSYTVGSLSDRFGSKKFVVLSQVIMI